MPQLALINGKLHDPVEFMATYTSDPLHPDKPGELKIAAKNTTGDWVDYAYAKVPGNVTHEMVSDALHAGWEAWLFGGSGDVRTAVARVVNRWKLYSKSIDKV